MVELPLLSGWRFFEARFDLSLGDGGGGEGVSVCVGVLPDAPFGERGVGDGLRVLLLTREARVEVHHGDELVVRVAMRGAALRTGRPVRVAVRYAAEGRASDGAAPLEGEPRGLSVLADGAWLVRDVLLPAWSPHAGWRLGIGARAGVGRPGGDNRVDNLLVGVGAEHQPWPAWVEVASNGQQYSQSAAPFMYTAPPAVSSVYPERGPVDGATQVVVSGANLGAGSHYVCGLGGVALVPASYNAIGGTIHCATTAAPFAVAAHELLPAALEVSLNAQQFTSSGVPFTFFARPSVSLASPSSGPTSGGTLVRLRGAGLGAGARFRCRIGYGGVSTTSAGSSLL